MSKKLDNLSLTSEEVKNTLRNHVMALHAIPSHYQALTSRVIGAAVADLYKQQIEKIKAFISNATFGGTVRGPNLDATVIHGTLRPQDLVPAFLQELWEQGNPHYLPLLKDWKDAAWEATKEGHLLWSEPDAEEMLMVLFNTLNEAAPEGYYFGAHPSAHPGACSNFGYWKHEEK